MWRNAISEQPSFQRSYRETFHAVLECWDCPLNETVGGRILQRRSHMTDTILFQELCELFAREHCCIVGDNYFVQT